MLYIAPSLLAADFSDLKGEIARMEDVFDQVAFQEWLDAHVDFMKHDAILNELEDMGGYCDCEVVANCYEDYEL